MKTALIIIVLATLTAIGVTGCGSSKSACDEAVGHVFTMGCQTQALPGTDSSTTESDAVDGCNGYEKLAESSTCNCKTSFDAAINRLKLSSQRIVPPAILR